MNFEEFKLDLFASPQSLTHAERTFKEIVRLLQYDDIVKQRTEQYRETRRVMGKQTANENIKKKVVPAFGVAVRFSGYGHAKDKAVGWTGLALCDIDNFDSPDLLEVAFERLSQDPYVLLMYRTISGRGLRIIYWYQRENGEPIDDSSWRGAFAVGNEYFANLAGHPFDADCNDFSRLSGMAHDEHLFLNYEAEPFLVPNDLIVSENCEFQEHGRPRKNYAPGTFHPEAEDVWPRIEEMLDEKNVKYEAHQHHDYIMHASYLFNRFGVPLDSLLVYASQIWSDYPQDERERAIRHQYKKVDNHGTWNIAGKKKGRENAMITLPDLKNKVIEHVFIRWNDVTDQMFFRERTPEDNDDTIDDLSPITSAAWKLVDDTMYSDLRILIANETGKRVLPGDVKSVVDSSITKHIHPVRQYMEKLPQWDGQDRICEVEQRIHVRSVHPQKSDDDVQAYLHWALKKWLISMVATWMDDHNENQAILTFIGPQGVNKTTFFRYLLPPPLRPYFWENAHNSFHLRDDHFSLTENCLVEIEEVDAFEGKDLSELKGLVTSNQIKERRPYAKFRTQKYRLASLCASGNDQYILTDKSGNRRWLCFWVDKIDNPREWQFDYEQFYAQLLSEYSNGFHYFFDKPEEARIEEMNQPFCQVSTEEELIVAHLRKPKPRESYKLMNATMIARFLGGGHLSTGISTKKIGQVMRQKQFRTEVKHNTAFYRVVEINYQDQQTYLLNDDLEETDDVGSQMEDVREQELNFEPNDDLPF